MIVEGLATLLALSHAALVRLLAANLGVHVQGLYEGSRRAGLSMGLRRRLKNLETAHSVVRHVTRPSVTGLLDEVQQELRWLAQVEADLPCGRARPPPRA